MGSYNIQNVASGICSCKQGGKSKWGTVLAATLPYWLGCENGATPWGSGGSDGNGVSSDPGSGIPWGSKNTTNANPYTDMPITGVVREYEWVISRGQIAPDGYLKDVMLVNGEFPGPVLEANWGDQIKINVYNNISGKDEGTALHWHGFLMTGTPYEDGVPGVTQCPIAPGTNYTYEFTAELYGTSWYHSHYSAQYSAGVVGPIVIYGPTNAPYDVDVGPVMISDWYHDSYTTIIDTMLQPNNTAAAFDIASQNNLINGRANFDCSTVAAGDNTPCISNAGISKFVFEEGKTHRLRLINTGSEGHQMVSIDGHVMTVIAQDFVPIQPFNTTAMYLGIGQRADVLVTANANGSAFWMRSNISSCSPANQRIGLAAIYYAGSDTNVEPTSEPWDVIDPGTCLGTPVEQMVPEYAMSVANPDYTLTMDIGLTVNDSDVTLITFYNVTAKVDYNNPILPEVTEGNLNFDPSANVINLGSNTTIRVVVNNPGPAPHPMHIHGHNMQVLHEGPDKWDGVTITNQNNPARRDVQQIGAASHMVMQFEANPGTWAWHCHIAWHVSAGFLSTLLVQTDEVEIMSLPAKVAQTCQNWDAFTSKNIPDQTDSGV